MKIGEASTRFNQLEAALDATQLGKQNAETEAALAKEKFEALKSDVKRIEAMVRLNFVTCAVYESEGSSYPYFMLINCLCARKKRINAM